jgi:hypothetical protein
MRKRNLLGAVAVFLGILLLLLSGPAPAKWSGFSGIPRLARTSRFSPGLLPFSFRQVLSYFDDAFQKPGFEIQDHTCVYVEGTGPDELVTLAVYSTGQKIGVTVLSGWDWGVNYIREFFEAPFFFRSESEQLYALLDSGAGARSATLSRFKVTIDVSETRKWIVIRAEFGPLGIE